MTPADAAFATWALGPCCTCGSRLHAEGPTVQSCAKCGALVSLCVLPSGSALRLTHETKPKETASVHQ